MNESETAALAAHLSLPKDEFVRNYAEFESEGWVKIRARNPKDSVEDTGVGCIFLSDDGKSCTVYPVRPKQCTTYPFFPRLLRTPETWNSEVVSGSKDEESASGRQWTVDSGGCEGMREVKNIRWNQKKGKWIVKRDIGSDEALDKIVSAIEIQRLSVEYEDYFATFPHEALLRVVGIST